MADENTQIEVDPNAAPAPTGTPAAKAPATKEALHITTEPEKVIVETEDSLDYEPTGDAGLDLALSFIGSVGIDPSNPAMAHALETGDLAALRAVLGSMGDKAKGFEAYLKVAETSLERMRTEGAAQVETVTQVVHGVVGGAENWSAIQEWARTNADASEKDAINAMLDAGPFQARAVAALLASEYAKAPGVVINPATSVKPNASAGVAPSSNALSPKEYSAEVVKLANKVGSGRLNDSPEYAALQRRALAYRPK